MKSKIQRFFWRLRCKFVFRSYTNERLNEFYVNLIRHGHESRFPTWQVISTFNCLIYEMNRRKKVYKK